MKRIEQILLLFLSSLFFCTMQGQNNTFKYDLKYKPNPSKDSIILERTVLDVNPENSIFRSEQEKQSDSLQAKTGFGLGRKMRFEDQFYTIKNLKDQKILKSIQTIYRDLFSIKIKDKLSWNILPEKLKIGDFDCQKATVQYGGRSWTAWFTQQIPLQDGPYIFHGLPGLIVKISDDENNFVFDLTEVKNLTSELTHRSKGTELTWEQYNKMALNYYSDPFARIKSSGAPYKVEDASGQLVSPNMKLEVDKLKRQIRENNNPIELSKVVKYR